MDHYRNTKGFDITCTEFMYGRCDVAAINEKEFIDFEVKVSISDLNRDKKKSKHIEYEKAAKGLLPYGKYCMPNKFYFAVPELIADHAVKICLKINPKYGVITFDEVNGVLWPRVVRRAKKLKPEPPCKNLILIGCKRLSYDNLVFRRKMMGIKPNVL